MAKGAVSRALRIDAWLAASYDGPRVAASIDVRLLLLVALGVFVLNLPFGYWRGGLRKLSPLWFVAIHAPVPLVVCLRLLAGLPFRLATLPLLVAAFFGGQTLGARFRASRAKSSSVTGA
jgi:hypothetical protein